MLTGIRVIEVAQFWMVPSGAALLGDWGADVIKVEHPVTGDAHRGLITGGLVQSAGSFNFMFEQPNRNKRSIGIDLASEAGHEVLITLVKQADVFITNFLPDARRRLRIDVEDIRAIKPDIIYARGHGYGLKGPDAGKGSGDGTAYYARAGVSYHMMRPDGPGPTHMRPAFGDGVGGLALAGGVAAALLGRERGQQEGRVVDVSLLGTGMWQIAPDIVAAGEIEGGLTRMTRETVPNPLVNSYQAADGRWIYFAVLQSERYWKHFCDIIERPDLLDDPRYGTQKARYDNRDACVALLDGVFATRTLAEWRDAFASFEGQWDPVQSAAELYRDPQVAANGFLRPVADQEGEHSLVPGPAQFDEMPPELRRAPEHGEHTEEVLLEYGYDWAQIAELKSANAIT
jgi:crotonobetainyl-CoA:carnitine CoA-transferase CaiB-like acyl-CoA transferase